MNLLFENAFYIASFTFVALASKQLGRYFLKINMPLISGFLFAGIFAGPFVLNLVPQIEIDHLQFVDSIALAYIAFAAGSELTMNTLRGRGKSIAWVTVGLVVATYALGAAAVYFLADYIPFMQTMPAVGRLSVALLAGAILVARSPSSAIAIVNEVRAKGPFTQTALGVIVITDVVVIVLFAINSEIADALLSNLSFSFGFVFLLLFELLLSVAMGIGVGYLLKWVLSVHAGEYVKSAMILGSGFGVFLLSDFMHTYTHEHWPFEILFEPLLICMIGGFFVINRTGYRDEFLHLLEEMGPPIYVAFFTLTGASLALDVLVQTWGIALILFAVRLGTIFVGAFSGGVVAGDSMQQNRTSWLMYVTQAGVGLGLAKEVAAGFPEWGAAFATVMISVIVLNQIVGPPMFKWALFCMNEAHPRADVPQFDGVRDAYIFGLKAQSTLLAKQLAQHDWQVKIVSLKSGKEAWSNGMKGVAVAYIDAITSDYLDTLEMEQADVVVAMFASDEDNYRVCELVYERYGTKTMVAWLQDQTNFKPFQRLGVQIVEPQTAVLGLLEHFVRSPAGTSLLMGMHDSQEVVDILMINPRLHGKAIRDLRLPVDVLVMSVNRNGHMIISHGYTVIELGDRLTVVGPEDALQKVALLFET